MPIRLFGGDGTVEPESAAPSYDIPPWGQKDNRNAPHNLRSFAPCRGGGADIRPCPPNSLSSFGLPPNAVKTALAEARRNGTDLARELVWNELVDEERLYAGIASRLDIPFAKPGPRDMDLDRPAMGDKTSRSRRIMKSCDGRLNNRIWIAPCLENIVSIDRLLKRRPWLRRQLRVTTITALRDHRAASSADERLMAADLSLSARHPRYSARSVMSGWQGMGLGLLLGAALALLHFAPAMLAWFLYAFAALTFSASSAFRLLAAMELRRRPATPPRVSTRAPTAGYTVLVALHREAAVVPELIPALDRLEWPRSRLDIKIVCEADDRETVAAVKQAISGKPCFQLVCVPPSEPRTKPKALNFALPLAQGDFVCLYDAEDRPHPKQLLEAWTAFESGPDKLACLQAPLVVRNGRASWLSGLFALEYAALFRGFLPWLERRNLPLPLGGTSNHFRVLM